MLTGALNGRRQHAFSRSSIDHFERMKNELFQMEILPQKFHWQQEV